MDKVKYDDLKPGDRLTVNMGDGSTLDAVATAKSYTDRMGNFCVRFMAGESSEEKLAYLTEYGWDEV